MERGWMGLWESLRLMECLLMFRGRVVSLRGMESYMLACVCLPW